MTKMVKVLYEERNTRLQGESSKPPKGEGFLGGVMETEVMEMETNLHPLHHLILHKQLHPLPLTQPLLILINIPQKELVDHPS